MRWIGWLSPDEAGSTWNTRPWCVEIFRRNEIHWISAHTLLISSLWWKLAIGANGQCRNNDHHSVDHHIIFVEGRFQIEEFHKNYHQKSHNVKVYRGTSQSEKWESNTSKTEVKSAESAPLLQIIKLRRLTFNQPKQLSDSDTVASTCLLSSLVITLTTVHSLVECAAPLSLSRSQPLPGGSLYTFGLFKSSISLSPVVVVVGLLL